jgi:murein tripeptide amidase MpaA
LKVYKLSDTVGGNLCPILKIGTKGKTRERQRTKLVFLSSRVHPGESVSSLMMEGLLDYLTGDSREAKFLRERFTFYIVPILNIDGVVNGNYRSDILGTDLNRRWLSPDPVD